MSRRRPRVVAIGGGHGLAQGLLALRFLDLEPTAVVSVADDGGSSGRLRRELGVVPPGDLRRALLALARDGELAELLRHRFTAGSLQGHALGNLALVAATERHDGDVVAGLDDLGRLLGCRGRVLPATTSPISLHAEAEGVHEQGQVRIATLGRRIERVWLEPEAPPVTPEAVAAIDAADLVVLGPGSLYTSVVAPLLVPGLAAAVAATRARVVHVANLAEQAGETEGLDLAGHVAGLRAQVPGLRLDAVITHEGPAVIAPTRALVPPTAGADVPLHTADVARRRDDGRAIAVHDPARLAGALAAYLPPS